TPILATYIALNRTRPLRNLAWMWTAAFAAPIAIVVWQLWERAATGALPAAVLAGYLQPLEVATQKLRSAVALLVHSGWIISPIIAAAAFRKPKAFIPAAIVTAAGAFYDLNLLFLISLACGALILTLALDYLRARDFLGWWISIFFIGALAIFFAGS